MLSDKILFAVKCAVSLSLIVATSALAQTPGSLGNISTRLQVGTGDNVLIAGFIVRGSSPKKVLIRAAGPSLTQFGVPGALANPQLELHSAVATIGTNDNWQTTQLGGVITSDQSADIQGSGFAPRDPAESAIIALLAPGNYTAIVQGVNGGTGVGIAEVYDLSPNNGGYLANISTRGFIQTNDNVMIGGFIAITQPLRLIVRAVGPSLTPFGVSNALANPKLELHDANGTIAGNDDWQTTQSGGIITGDQVPAIQGSTLAPSNSAESAIIATLAPGNYTAIVQGVSATTGVGLIEVYALYDYNLTVTKTGTGAGRVSSSPAGIDCGAACNAIYNSGTTVALTAIPSAGSSFSGWGGACTGTGSCNVTMDAAKSVTATFTLLPCSGGPTPYLVESNVVSNAINTAVTIYASQLTLPLPANSVTIVLAGQTSPVTSLTGTAVSGHPDQIRATVAAGLAAGSYDLRLTDGSGGCTGVLTNAIKVTSSATVTLQSVTPPFAYNAVSTSVVVARNTSAVAPVNQVFQATPRVFIYPSTPSAGEVAITIQSVSFVDGNTLSVVIPPSIAAKNYDLILVNPDGTTGMLPNALRVQSTPPPIITAATPSSIISASGQTVVLSGTDFVGSTVSAACVDSSGSPTTAPSLTATAPSCTNGNCTVTATINASTIASGSVCQVRVTNSDGSSFDYSAVGVTNSSLKLAGTKQGAPLVTARRALVAASGNATPSKQFVYAIGGDNGSAANPVATGEVASVSPFGVLGAWRALPTTLNTPRTFAASTTIGRYVYVLGGSDGTNALATAERAMILDPAETPQATLSDIVPAASGLSAGDYVYSVAATFSSSDLDNPTGESLPSPEVVARVPAITGQKADVNLAWSAPVDRLGNALPNVNGYRIYRSPLTPGVSGDEVLLATVSGTTLTYTDDGTVAPGSAKPSLLGYLGKWRVLPSMGSTRQGLGTVSAPDPSFPTSKRYVYALLGENTATTTLATYEYLPVNIAANGHQTLGAAWIAGTQQTLTARWQLGVWAADSTTSSIIAAPDTWIFMGGGVTALGAAASAVDAGKVAIGGDLGAISSTPKDFVSTRAGYGVCAANGQLFAFGGANAASSNSVTTAFLASPSPTLTANSWNAEGLTLNTSRYLTGSTVLGPFIFLIGGDSGSGTTTSTEVVLW